MILDGVKTGLWPHPYRKKSFEFEHPDDEESFKENLKKFGPEWHYAKKKIVYECNSLGYRTKELEHYKDKDFVLVMGCSHTEGHGLAEDELWHCQITKEFGLEVLNAGFAGSGADLHMMNTMLFLRYSGLRPKAVVIQWPNLSRVMFKGDSLKRLLVPNTKINFEGPSGDSLWEKFKREQEVVTTFYKWWIYDNNDINNSWIYIDSVRLMWKMAKIPFYDFSMDPDPAFTNDEKFNNHFHQIQAKDHARDQIHYGPKFNEELGQIVCNNIRGLF